MTPGSRLNRHHNLPLGLAVHQFGDGVRALGQRVGVGDVGLDLAGFVELEDLLDVLLIRGRMAGDGGDAPPVESRLLSGVYPNQFGEGVGRGHLWALRQLLERGLT